MTEATPETPASPEPSETDAGRDWKAEAEKWKSLSRKNEETAKANAAAAKRLDEIESANATELERAIKKAKEEGRTEVQQSANSRLIAAEARALAAEAKFRNPALAIKAVDLSGIKVADDGSVDGTAIKALLADLAKDEPYLIDDGRARPKPDEAQGQTRGTPKKGAQGIAEAQKRFGVSAEQKQ